MSHRCSRGKTKSKVTKSVKFGGGRWQVLFYANSGVTGTAASGANETSTNEGDEDGFISLYLSCEVSANLMRSEALVWGGC